MAKDLYNNAVRVALEKDNWIITEEEIKLATDKPDVLVNLASEKILMAERQGEKIAVEITTFKNPSLIDTLITSNSEYNQNNFSIFYLSKTTKRDMLIRHLQKAFVQYLCYLEILSDCQLNHVVYLAITKEMYSDCFQGPIIRFILANSLVKLMIFDYHKEEIVRWKDFEIYEVGDRDFYRIDLHKLELSSVLNESDFTKANLSETIIHRTEMNLSNLSEANFNKADLTEVFFHKSNLSQVDFTDAHLTEVFLVSSDLSQVNMNRTQIIQSYLKKANLRNANLTESIFGSVDFKGADLRGADLRKSQFIFCDLRDANLQNAIVDEAIFDDVQLNGAKWVDGTIISQEF